MAWTPCHKTFCYFMLCFVTHSESLWVTFKRDPVGYFLTSAPQNYKCNCIHNHIITYVIWFSGFGVGSDILHFYKLSYDAVFGPWTKLSSKALNNPWGKEKDQNPVNIDRMYLPFLPFPSKQVSVSDSEIGRVQL